MKMIWKAIRWDIWRDAMEGAETLGLYSSQELAVMAVKNDAVNVVMTWTGPVEQGDVTWHVYAVLLDDESWTKENPDPPEFNWTVDDAWADVDRDAYDQAIKKWRETKDLTVPFGRGLAL